MERGVRDAGTSSDGVDVRGGVAVDIGRTLPGAGAGGAVQYLIPDPVEKTTGTSAAEGIALDRSGIIYGAEGGPRAVKRYVRR
jgi:hypothetical protein